MQGLARLVLCFIARDTNLCWQNKYEIVARVEEINIDIAKVIFSCRLLVF